MVLEESKLYKIGELISYFISSQLYGDYIYLFNVNVLHTRHDSIAIIIGCNVSEGKA